MEGVENIAKLLWENGVEIEKIEKNRIYAKDSNGEILIRISNTKPKLENFNRKLIVISPYVAKRIDAERMKKILEKYSQPIFINKKNIETITVSTLFKIVNYLKENPNAYIKKISEDLKIHPEIVRRNLLKIKDYIEIKEFGTGMNLPKLPKLISLKEEIPLEKLKEIAKTKITIVSSEKKRKRRMKYERISKEEALIRILKFIEENPGTYLREISRELKISPSLVYSCLKEVSEFLELSSPIGKEDIELPNLPISIKLKQGYRAEGIIRYLRFKKMLKI
jgi:DNA-binding Lrp family transcriptional regulator